MENQNVSLSSGGAATVAVPSSKASPVSEKASPVSEIVRHAVTPSTASVVRGDPVYLSPKGVVDPQSGLFVLQYRDSSTGDVEVQYPSPKAVKAYHAGSEFSAQPVSTQQSDAKAETSLSTDATGGASTTQRNA